MKTALALAIVCVLMGTMSANPVEKPVEKPAEDPAMEGLMKIESDLEGLKETIEELGEIGHPKEDPMETQEGEEVAMEKRGIDVGENTVVNDAGEASNDPRPGCYNRKTTVYCRKFRKYCFKKSGYTAFRGYRCPLYCASAGGYPIPRSCGK
jgi:hypothetical protein